MPDADVSADVNPEHTAIKTAPGHRLQATSLPPGQSLQERLSALREAATAGQNVILLAAGQLLRALAETPEDLASSQLDTWRRLLEEEIVLFTRVCEQLNVRRDHMLAARYVLCTALDESAGLAPWSRQKDGTGLWSNMALLPQFHGEREGGEVVFMLLGRMANAPQEHMQVLELIQHVLSLGYMGQYRTKPDGHRQLESIRHRLHAMVSQGREPVMRELSVRWRGAAAGKFRLLRAVPVWVSASLLGLVLLAQFGWSKYQLLTQSEELSKRVHALRQLQSAHSQVARLGLSRLLADDIAKGMVTVTEDEKSAVVVFRGDGMFAKGQSSLGKTSSSVVEKVGHALQMVEGRVIVSGHTDNQPLGDPAGRNQLLSLARAQEVAKVLQAQGVRHERLDVQGRADREPMVSNDSEAGRAQNRRVVIEVLTQAQ